MILLIWIIYHAWGPSPSAPPTEAHSGNFSFENHCFCVKMMFFWSKNGSGLIRDDVRKNINFWIFHQIFWHFFRHISWSFRVFPWSNRAHIKPAQSSNIVLKKLLRIYQSVKYIYQKYEAKGSKSQTSAGTPRISRRPVQWQWWGRVLRTT